mmetsp:Transcript_12950/g.24337  ORF Transcript_12950/g.24337 Transcript_12950/m.24337 type:complete len:454 (+) Transcript_12950:70-1431(+)
MGQSISSSSIDGPQSQYSRDKRSSHHANNDNDNDNGNDNDDEPQLVAAVAVGAVAGAGAGIEPNDENSTVGNGHVNISKSDDDCYATTSNHMMTVTNYQSSSYSSSYSSSSTMVTSLSDILTLTNSEIKARLANTPFSIQNIREARDVIVKYDLCIQDDVFSWYQDQSNPPNQNQNHSHNHNDDNGNYGNDSDKADMVTTNHHKSVVMPCQRKSFNNKQDDPTEKEAMHHQNQNHHRRHHRRQEEKDATTRNLMTLALFMLKVSPQLKNVRFKMVPSKISESYFWNAVFYLLLQPCERDNLIYGCGYGVEMDKSHGGSGDGGGGGDDPLKMMLLRKNREMELLQQQVMQLKQTVATLQQQQKQLQQQQEEQQQQKQNSNHCGKWIMDKESHEFLALDEEIKSKLRDGKKKRLEDVQEQMKFILDSDNVEDSRGRWDCCGEKSYKSKCSCSSSK